MAWKVAYLSESQFPMPLNKPPTTHQTSALVLTVCGVCSPSNLVMVPTSEEKMIRWQSHNSWSPPPRHPHRCAPLHRLCLAYKQTASQTPSSVCTAPSAMLGIQTDPLVQRDAQAVM